MNECSCCFRSNLTLIKTYYTKNPCCVACELMIRKMVYIATSGKAKSLTPDEIKTLEKGGDANNN